MISGFISYSNADKRRAAEVKVALAEWGVDGFMAHEDIRVSEQWRERILEELRRMDVFVPLLSAEFKKSDWAAQESGAAALRKEVLIIPVSLDGTLPFGFLSHYQGKKLSRPVEPDFFRTVLLAERPHAVIDVMITGLTNANTFRQGESLLRPLVPLFDSLTPAEAERIIDLATSNNQIWDAAQCRLTYLPELLEKARGKVPATKLTQLRNLIA